MKLLLRRFPKKIDVYCPYCETLQKVSKGTISTYCKNCNSQIKIESGRSTRRIPKKKWKSSTKKITCPYCNHQQEVLAFAISTYCKNCFQRISLKESTSTQLTIIQNLDMREITCPHCNAYQKVPNTALSSFCTECGNRINLQNYTIETRFLGDIETKGIVFISPNGKVEGNITSGRLLIAGFFKGTASAENGIELHPTAKVFGKLISPTMKIASGSTFIGKATINRKHE